EWALLELFLGMTMEEVEAFGWRGTNQGLKLKGATTTFWLPPNEGASNSSQFHALPGGYRHEEGQFFNLRAQAAMWTASGDDNMLGVYRSLQFDEARIERWGATKKTGMSVRCVKDY
ncbi:MAG: fibrobacter succinogenes major paralogous domain-containing protein, partial [Bacteroidales bacterium]|nr:fibrobacter succinogenes major paralogous domain-containing protein [Bacteroidales bacterium]